MTSSGSVTAFFGATGGCALNALVKTLKDGQRAVALARTPSKLTDMLKAAPHDISQSTLDAQLTIYKGSATEIDDVKKMLANEPVDLIVSGLGGTPAGFRLSLRSPIKVDQPSICGDSIKTVLAALKQLEKENPNYKKPFYVVISTTGCVGALGEANKQDVPLLLQPLYYVLLEVPHADKNAMESLIADEGRKSDSILSGWAIIRPTLLTSAQPKGVDKIRHGWLSKEEQGPGPAKGYFVSRADVGIFIYEKFIKGTSAEWSGRVVTLTN